MTGAMRYDQEAAEAARDERPGRGYRADLAAEAVAPEDFLRLTNDDAIPVEHRALWALLWEGGLRIGDALALDVRDVAPDEHKISVDYPKSDRDERAIPLSDQTAALARAAIGDRTEGPLFVNQRGTALSRVSAARFARLAAHGIHAFRTGGHQVRKGKKPPRIKFPALDLEAKADGAAAKDSPCQCMCVHVHPYKPDVCLGESDPVLLVDVTIESPMSGEPEDRRLRPFCQGCYDAVLSGKALKKTLKKMF
ncbi:MULTISPECIES: tyrosine-type recombinase/integrase [Streptomyces]|uniref:tyrosine-type recombinase/integrase n=1 Tax=Streptomyces TaxID=1883 RepID=UPI00131C64C3|nr:MULTISPECIES: tyrosine-type recombinase/integrase [Streptomyces]